MSDLPDELRDRAARVYAVAHDVSVEELDMVADAAHIRAVAEILAEQWSAEEDARFTELRTLKENWDGFNANPVYPDMEERARAILADLRGRPRIYPTPEGGIQLEWKDVEITVEPNGMSAMFGESCLEESE